MRAWKIFCKTLLEMSRDKWILGLTLAFAPFFVLMYYLITSGGSTTYTVLVINQDEGARLLNGSLMNAGEDVIEAIKVVTYADGSPLLKVQLSNGLSEAEPILKERGAVAFILIPPDFSKTVQSLQSGDRSVTPRRGVSTQVRFGGDLSNPYYVIAASLALTAVDGYLQQATGQQPLIGYVEQALGSSAARTEFEIYVPGTLVFAVIMLIFLASMSVAREIESGALKRLKLTRMTSLDLLGGITAALVLVGSLSIALALAVAVACGFRSLGPLWVAVVVGAVTSLSVIGLGMLVASFTRTVSQAFIVANFPMALMMFFSGVIYPLPKITVLTLGGRAIGLYDVLPPTHAVAALNKILVLGAGLGELTYELTALIGLSVLYFGVGVWLFQRIHLRAG